MIDTDFYLQDSLLLYLSHTTAFTARSFYVSVIFFFKCRNVFRLSVDRVEMIQRVISV